MNIQIRKARIDDVPSLYNVVYELAVFEKEPEALTTSLESYEDAFSENLIDAIVAEDQGEIVGMVLYYMTFSTWKGKSLYLEDFYVKEAYRQFGIGQSLSASVGVEDYKLDLFSSLFSSGYTEWKKVGRYELNTLVSTSRQLLDMHFRANGDLILASANGSGKDPYSTAVCRIAGVFDPLGDVECVHPVYWVDPIAGSDGNTGYAPDAKWKTVRNAITANRVPFGGLVSVGPGYSDEGTTTITPACKTTGRPGRPEIPVWVRGAGRKATTLALNLSGVGIQMATALYPIRFSKLHVTNIGTGCFLSSGASVPVTSTAQFDDVYITGGGSPFRQESARFVIREFEAQLPAASALIIASFATANSSILVEAGAIMGGQWGIYWMGTAGADCTVQNVTGVNQTTALVEAVSAAVIFPTVRNCAIQGAAPGLKDARP